MKVNERICIVENQFNQLLKDIHTMKSQIGQAGLLFAREGKKFDTQWLIRAKTALKYKNREFQNISHKLAEMRREERINKSKAWPQAFVSVVKKNIDQETFERFVLETNNIMGVNTDLHKEK